MNPNEQINFDDVHHVPLNKGKRKKVVFDLTYDAEKKRNNFSFSPEKHEEMNLVGNSLKVFRSESAGVNYFGVIAGNGGDFAKTKGRGFSDEALVAFLTKHNCLQKQYKVEFAGKNGQGIAMFKLLPITDQEAEKMLLTPAKVEVPEIKAKDPDMNEDQNMNSAPVTESNEEPDVDPDVDEVPESSKDAADEAEAQLAEKDVDSELEKEESF